MRPKLDRGLHLRLYGICANPNDGPLAVGEAAAAKKKEHPIADEQWAA